MKIRETSCIGGGFEKSRFEKEKKVQKKDLLLLAALLGKKHRLDVGQDTSLSNGHS